jgi:hypothetical protein
MAISDFGLRIADLKKHRAWSIETDEMRSVAKFSVADYNE